MSFPLSMNQSQQTVYEQLGGDPIFRQLVEVFYAGVEQDPILRPMFPDGLEVGKERQFLFLTQYWGGPTRYQEERGDPRLRMRHNPFPITEEASNAWLRHMISAMDEVGIVEPIRSQMVDHFQRAAVFLINKNATEE